jgi:hypothetical protein
MYRLAEFFLLFVLKESRLTLVEYIDGATLSRSTIPCHLDLRPRMAAQKQLCGHQCSDVEERLSLTQKIPVCKRSLALFHRKFCSGA